MNIKTNFSWMILVTLTVPILAMAQTPTYQIFTAPSGIASNAGEPSIGADWKTGKILFQAVLETDRITINPTNPATATWEKVSPVTSSVLTLDPILFTDPTTGRTFVSELAGVCSLSSFSDDDGANFTPAVGCGVPAGVDHQTIGGGPFAPAAVPVLPLPVGYQHAVYYCSQAVVDASCALSIDGGLSYGPAVPIYTLAQCVGLHGHIKVGPDGTAYVPNKNCGGAQAVIVSMDNGLTWTVHTIPGSTPADSDPSVAIGSDNTVYFGWQNGNSHPMVAVSRNHGATWSTPQDVGTALGVQNIAFPAMVAGDGDRAALAFLGTTTGGNAQDLVNFTGVWHLFIAHSFNRGSSWTLVDATPNDPVQRGSICLQGTACGQDRNLLDFIDATVDRQGRVLVGYADGCIGLCVSTPPNSFTAIGSIARQATGKGVFASFDGSF
ncbi:MAG TPA: sialidase family protein [Candidatus Angelobacter sp.]|nr:sialidase family protein [Candidatus Angelobacter sp.]